MTKLHTYGSRFATYYRMSNRHDWVQSITAADKVELVRALVRNQLDFPAYQHGYILVDPAGAELDNLPSNTALVRQVSLMDTDTARTAFAFAKVGAVSLLPKHLDALIQLGLLEKDTEPVVSTVDTTKD